MTWLQEPYRMQKKENDLRAAFLYSHFSLTQ